MTFGSGGLSATAGDSLPTEHSYNSQYTIKYDDWDLLLSSAVLDVGRSDRRSAGRSGLRNTQTRIRHGNYSVTANEGNRVLFDKFKQPHRDNMLAIRQDLEAVPDFIPLEEFSKNEQLAYWLNLHNVAVMLEVARKYPIKKVKSLHAGRTSVWDNKTMSIGGVPTSIRDIETHVVTNWNDPLVLYGFFMGAVGGPSIRDHAFTGDNVVKSLRDNAIEFINSIRGFKLWSGRGRVSDHYQIGAHYFPNFDEDIKNHMRVFANADTERDLHKAGFFRIKNYDWGIADLKNGDTYGGGSFNTSSGLLTFFIQNQPNSSGAAGTPPPGSILSDSFVGNPMFNRGVNGKLPPQTKALLRAIQSRKERRAREGTVTVEEFVGGDGSRIVRKDAKEDIAVSPQDEGDEEKPLA